VTNPNDFFPNRLIPEREGQENTAEGKAIVRLLDLFEWIGGFDETFFQFIRPALQEEYGPAVYASFLTRVYTQLNEVTTSLPKIHRFRSLIQNFTSTPASSNIFWNRRT
jgi:hypothetical protein